MDHGLFMHHMIFGREIQPKDLRDHLELYWKLPEGRC